MDSINPFLAQSLVFRSLIIIVVIKFFEDHCGNSSFMQIFQGCYVVCGSIVWLYTVQISIQTNDESVE